MTGLLRLLILAVLDPYWLDFLEQEFSAMAQRFQTPMDVRHWVVCGCVMKTDVNSSSSMLRSTSRSQCEWHGSVVLVVLWNYIELITPVAT